MKFSDFTITFPRSSLSILNCSFPFPIASGLFNVQPLLRPQKKRNKEHYLSRVFFISTKICFNAGNHCSINGSLWASERVTSNACEAERLVSTCQRTVIFSLFIQTSSRHFCHLLSFYRNIFFTVVKRGSSILF